MPSEGSGFFLCFLLSLDLSYSFAQAKGKYETDNDTR